MSTERDVGSAFPRPAHAFASVRRVGQAMSEGEAIVLVQLNTGGCTERPSSQQALLAAPLADRRTLDVQNPQIRSD